MVHRFPDVFRSFREHDVRYVVIGGIAAVLHGVPRATFDLDILIEATPENVARLLRAMLDAGLGTASLTTVEKVLDNEITIFKDRIRLDVRTSTPGVTFEAAWTHRQVVEFEGETLNLVSLPHLVATKKAAGRPVDLEDVPSSKA
jgi:hypothetical protein